jgi:uncharacterized protein (DUF433 family)
MRGAPRPTLSGSRKPDGRTDHGKDGPVGIRFTCALKSQRTKSMLNASGNSEGFIVEMLSNDPSSVEKLTISEAEAVTGVKKNHINRLLDDGHFDSLWAVDRVSGRRMLDLDLCVFVKFHEDAGKLLVPKARHKVWSLFVEKVNSSRTPIAYTTLGANSKTFFFVLDNTLSVDLTPHCLHVINSWATLRRSRAEIKSDPDIRGGVPVIVGTRIGAYEVADVVDRAGVEEALEMYPSLDREKVDAAVLYAKANPRPGRPPRGGEYRSGKLRLKSSRKLTRRVS